MTDNTTLTALREFYLNTLVPAGKQADLANSPDSTDSTDGESFFVKRHAPYMTTAEFELDLSSRSQFARILEAQWEAKGLGSIAQPMISLGELCEDTEQTSDLSTTVYEMF